MAIRQQTDSSAASDRVMFWKAFLYVTADAARWTTVAVDQPSTARLYYIPFKYWSSASNRTTLSTEDLASGQQAITFESCAEQPYGYTGGVMTQGSACVSLTIRAEGHPDAKVRLPLGVSC